MLAGIVVAIALFVGGLVVVGDLLFGPSFADRRDHSEARRFDARLAEQLAAH